MDVTAVVLLGASQFSHIPSFSNPSFKTSKSDLEDYLRRPAPYGMGLPSAAFLDLFDSNIAPGQQLLEVAKFLDKLKGAHPDSIRNLIVYYVGHGYFPPGSRDFFVALAQTNEEVYDTTGLKFASLSGVLKKRAKSFRFFYLLDCCFAGEVLRATLGDADAVARLATAALDVDGPRFKVDIPRRGAAALCATSPDDLALAPQGLRRTIFTDALVDVLARGDRELPNAMTLADVRELVWEQIRRKHSEVPENQIRPYLGSPDQTEGDIATKVALFPNPSFFQAEQERQAAAARQAEQDRQVAAARQAERERQEAAARRAEEEKQAAARRADEERKSADARIAEQQRQADQQREGFQSRLHHLAGATRKAERHRQAVITATMRHAQAAQDRKAEQERQAAAAAQEEAERQRQARQGWLAAVARPTEQEWVVRQAELQRWAVAARQALQEWLARQAELQALAKQKGQHEQEAEARRPSEPDRKALAEREADVRTDVAAAHATEQTAAAREVEAQQQAERDQQRQSEDSAEVICTLCGGRGVTGGSIGMMPYIRKCPRCLGIGRVDRNMQPDNEAPEDWDRVFLTVALPITAGLTLVVMLGFAFVPAFRDLLLQDSAIRAGLDQLGRPPTATPQSSASTGASDTGPKTSGRGAKENFRDCPDCPEMVHIPAGNFVMGSPEIEKGREADEGPQHTVHVPAFSIGKYTVTFDEWDACVKARGCSKNPSDQGWGRGRRPVINVSREDVQQYLRWLSTKTGHRYRRPSEAEWEYAARAGTTTRYYWGNEIGEGHANCKGCGSQWDGKQTAPVGSFAPNPWGLYDMPGNVWQWTQDCYHFSYNGAPADGRAWTWGDECRLFMTTRGGAWSDIPSSLRAAVRGSPLPTLVDNATGFRLARDND
jgi:formylglycine-generating enzyme required for sulfatase activity